MITEHLRDVYEQRAVEFYLRVVQQTPDHIEDKVADAIKADEYAAIEGIVGLLQAFQSHPPVSDAQPAAPTDAIGPESAS